MQRKIMWVRWREREEDKKGKKDGEKQQLRIEEEESDEEKDEEKKEDEARRKGEGGLGEERERSAEGARTQGGEGAKE